MSTREDIHKPSLLDPAAYEFICGFYQGTSDEMYRAYEDDMAVWVKVVEDSGKIFQGNYQTKSTCDHCGATFAHGICFRHTPTGEFIHVGHICANDTIGLPSRAAALKRAAEKAAAAAKKLNAYKAANAAWREANHDIVDFLGRESARMTAYGDAMEAHNETGSPMPSKFDAPHPFVMDMVHSFNRYGGLTENQTNATHKFLAKEAQDAADAETLAAAGPLTEGRRVITGTIISTKWQDSDFGETLKMLVKEDDGNKV